MYVTLKDTDGGDVRVGVFVDTLPKLWIIHEDGYRQPANELSEGNRETLRNFLASLLEVPEGFVWAPKPRETEEVGIENEA